MGIKPTVRVVRRKHKDAATVLRGIEGLHGPLRVKVGFPKGMADSDVIARAVYNNFGTIHIPPRPFMLLAWRQNFNKHREALRRAAKALIHGTMTRDQVGKRLGVMGENDVKQAITDLKTPPNAESTIRMKGSSNPLIDTGEMRQSVRYKVD